MSAVNCSSPKRCHHSASELAGWGTGGGVASENQADGMGVCGKAASRTGSVPQASSIAGKAATNMARPARLPAAGAENSLDGRKDMGRPHSKRYKVLFCGHLRTVCLR